MNRPALDRGEHHFVDRHGVTIAYYSWRPPSPRGVVQLVHGVGEYALRYDQLARELAASGYAVYADDHRGHGQTGVGQWGGDASRLGRLGVGGLRATVEAVHRLSRIARDDNAGRRPIILGQSWGSLMAQILLNRFSDDYAAAVLTGTAYRMPGSMNGGDLNRRHAHLGSTRFEWLSRDPAVVAAMAVDPLAFEASVVKLFGLRDSLRLFGRPARRLAHDLPMLIMVGSDDALGGARSAEKLARAYRERSGLSDVELLVYEGARHEVLRESNRDEVVHDLLGWLDAHPKV